MKIPIPREHGTWAMLYAPILCAIVSVGRVNTPLFLFLFSTTAAFFMREPLEKWVRLSRAGSKDRERIEYSRKWTLVYFALALAPAVWLVAVDQLRLLPVFASFFGIMIVIHLYWMFTRRDRKLYAELAAVAALTSSAPACRYVMIGSLDREAFVLWALNALFFASSVFYLKMRVGRIAKNNTSPRASYLSAAYHFSLTLALALLCLNSLISWMVLLAFVPVVVRAFAGMMAHGKLSLTRIGISEIAFTAIFVCLMALSFR